MNKLHSGLMLLNKKDQCMVVRELLILFYCLVSQPYYFGVYVMHSFLVFPQGLSNADCFLCFPRSGILTDLRTYLSIRGAATLSFVDFT